MDQKEEGVFRPAGSGTIMGTGADNGTLLSSLNGHVDRGKETKEDADRES